MSTPKLVNVACSNEACSKPLFAFHIKNARETRLESYGAAVRFEAARLGVDRRVWAICEACGVETELDPKVAARMPG